MEGSAQVGGLSESAGIQRGREEDETMDLARVEVLMDERVSEINNIGIEDMQYLLR